MNATQNSVAEVTHHSLRNNSGLDSGPTAKTVLHEIGHYTLRHWKEQPRT